MDEKYKFTCQCRACMDNWKTAQELPKYRNNPMMQIISMLIRRSFNDISMDQLKLSGSHMEAVQAKMKNIMVIGAKINQVNKF